MPATKATTIVKHTNVEYMRLPYTQVIANIQGYMYRNVCPNMSKRLYKYTLASRCYYMKNYELSGQLKKLNLTTTQYFTPRLRV